MSAPTENPPHPAESVDHTADRPAAWVLTRLPGFLLAAAGLAVLIVAAALDANPAGYGTHTQLGWAPCGFKDRTGLPCATCGMTTATTLAADGRFLDALRVQPGGFLFALACGAAVWIGGWSAATGRSLVPLARALFRPAPLLTLGGLLLFAWAYRIADVTLGQGWSTL